MPTHNDLLNAEVAFILYNGQVYMSHPTDNDVSLTKLIRQIGNLGHLDNPLVESIQAFLRGSEEAPTGLELVGRYNMANGRIAPYGPVNNAENQQTVRDAIQQAAYDAAGSSPDQSSEDASTNPDSGIQSASSWRMGRQFMPLVDKVTQDKCPFCGQKRSLYHMKDGYMAQAMGVYGYPLCRDCLTTRMDQHEQSTGMKISRRVSRRGFVRTSADVQELAEKMISRIYEEGLVPKQVSEKEHLYQQRFMELMSYLLKEAPETYKLWPFLARSFKKDRAAVDQLVRQDIRVLLPAFQHIKDILQQATIHLERMRDDPRPDVKVPNVMQEFKPGPNGNYSWDQLQNWVYEQNAQHGTPDPDDYSTVVYQWPDGWTIRELTADDLAREGELMGHCVGGYCSDVRTHSSHIYSLRDPQNGPHVTFEVEGQPMYTPLNPDRTPEEEHARVEEQMAKNEDPSVYSPSMGMGQYQKTFRPGLSPPPPEFEYDTRGPLPHPNAEGQYPLEWPSWKVIQIQGKSDKEPIPEYRQRINEFMQYVRSTGAEVEWHPEDAIRPGGNEEDYISDLADTLEYYQEFQNGNYNTHDYPSIRAQETDREYDDYGLPKRALGAGDGLYVAYNGGLEDIVNQAVQEFTDSDVRGRNFYREMYYDTDPETAARAILFLVEQLKIQEQMKNAASPGVSNRDWDAELQKAVEQAWQIVDKERDDHRDRNWEFEHGNLQYTHEQIWEDYNREHGFEEGDEGYIDPEDKEFDYDHPEMERAQNYVDEELYGPWKKATEFLSDLSGATALKQHPNQITLPGERGQMQQYTPTQEDLDALPGAFSAWQLQSR